MHEQFFCESEWLEKLPVLTPLKLGWYCCIMKGFSLVG
jgi:hypothetical protein